MDCAIYHGAKIIVCDINLYYHGASIIVYLIGWLAVVFGIIAR